MEAYVHSIETMGALDGPGLRTVFFLQGCAARCIYCHNPDTWPLKRGQLYRDDELVKLAEKYKSYYKGDGGVTFSGGEALMQGGFILSCMEKLASKGISTVIDASGTYVDVHTRDIFKRAQLVLLDIKHTKRQQFYKITGRSIDTLFRVIELINDEEVPVWIRQVIVPGLNDTPKDMEALKEFVRYIPTVEKIELLPYHDMGVPKWKEMGVPYKLEQTPPLAAEKLQELQTLVPIYARNRLGKIVELPRSNEDFLSEGFSYR